MEGTKDLRVSGLAHLALVSRTAGRHASSVIGSPPSKPSHRWTNDPDGDAYCIDCAQTWRPDAPTIPCDTERRVCESCRQHPASVWLYGFAVCGPCASAGEPR